MGKFLDNPHEKINLLKDDNIISLYSKITNKMRESELNYVKVLTNDNKLINILNETRNKNSKAHLNGSPKISEDIFWSQYH